MAYLVAFSLGGDLSKGLKVLAPVTYGVCGLAQHLAPNKFNPDWSL